MSFLGHFSYPVLTFVVAAKVLNIQYSAFDLFILVLFATLPDLIDFLTVVISKKIKISNFRHHQWATHCPVAYLPFFLLPFFNFNLLSVLIAFGLASHFLMDMFFNSSGIMLFYPFSKKFFYIYPKKTFGCYGYEWMKIYRSLLIWKLDIAASLIFLLLLMTKLV